MIFINAPHAVITSAGPSATKLVCFTPTAEAVLHLPRAGLETTSSSSTTVSSSSATTTRPFFQDPSTITPSSKPNNGQEDNTLAKSVLEYAILAVGIVIIGSLILQRCVRLRRHNEPLSRFFSFTPHSGIFSSSSSHPFAHPPRFPRTTGLSEVPPYPYAQRTRANDTDAAGRRLGGLQSSDHDGYIGDKDVLPAYDNAGGPPKYRDLEMMPMPNRNSGSGEGTGTGTGTGTGAGTNRGIGTGASIVSRTAVGCTEPGVREPSGLESRSHTYSPPSGFSPNPDVERGDAILPPAPVYVREHFGT